MVSGPPFVLSPRDMHLLRVDLVKMRLPFFGCFCCFHGQAASVLGCWWEQRPQPSVTGFLRSEQVICIHLVLSVATEQVRGWQWFLIEAAS